MLVHSFIELVLISSLAVLGAQANGEDRPEPLVQMQRNRDSIQAAHIEWTQENRRQGERSARPDRPPMPATVQMVARIAPGQVLTQNLSQPARMTPGQSFTSAYMLKSAPGVWKHVEEMPEAELYTSPRAIGVFDPRTFGAGLSSAGLSLEDTLWKSFGDSRHYREYEENGLKVVEATSTYGKVRWWIDTVRAWNPVRTEIESTDGQLISRYEATLKQYGEVWFPETVNLYEGAFKAGREPATVIRITKALFNDASLPSKLTPGDIGVEAGMTVNVSATPADRTSQEARIWDGSALVAVQEAEARILAGSLKVSPKLRQRSANIAESNWQQQRGNPANANRSRIVFEKLSAWEMYTQSVVQQYKLDAEQSQKAAEVLRECQQQADAYGKAHRMEFEEMEPLIKSLSDLQLSNPERQRIEARRAEVEKPLDEIFHKQLVPRLDKLPTKAQREAFEKEHPKLAIEQSERSTKDRD